MDIKLGREKEIRLNITHEGKNMKEKVKKRLKEKSERSLRASKKRED